MRARLRRYRVETARNAVSLWSGRLLVEDEEPGGAGGEARGRGGLGRKAKMLGTSPLESVEQVTRESLHDLGLQHRSLLAEYDMAQNRIRRRRPGRSIYSCLLSA